MKTKKQHPARKVRRLVGDSLEGKSMIVTGIPFTVCGIPILVRVHFPKNRFIANVPDQR